MSDPTIATVDAEPWNQSKVRDECAKDAAAVRWAASQQSVTTVSPIEEMFSIYERVLRGIPILVNGSPAQYVYDRSGTSTQPERCYQCKAHCMLTMWHEWRYAPNDPVSLKHNRAYVVVRMMLLCNTCSNSFRALPLGAHWPLAEP